jgi:hypothetical protein
MVQSTYGLDAAPAAYFVTSIASGLEPEHRLRLGL